MLSARAASDPDCHSDAPLKHGADGEGVGELELLWEPLPPLLVVQVHR